LAKRTFISLFYLFYFYEGFLFMILFCIAVLHQCISSYGKGNWNGYIGLKRYIIKEVTAFEHNNVET